MAGWKLSHIFDILDERLTDFLMIFSFIPIIPIIIVTKNDEINKWFDSEYKSHLKSEHFKNKIWEDLDTFCHPGFIAEVKPAHYAANSQRRLKRNSINCNLTTDNLLW